jgi:nitroreductase
VLHDGLGARTTPRVKKSLIRAKSFRETVLSRRSIRHYKSDPVPKDLIDELLDVARYSPTASNLQNVCYTIVTDRHTLDEVAKRLFGFGDSINKVFVSRPVQIASLWFKDTGPIRTLRRYSNRWSHFKEQVASGIDLVFHKAPILLLIHAPKGQNLAMDNCMIAAGTVANYAHALGLGTCFIGILTTAMRLDRSLYRRFQIPEGHRVYAALTLGYPAIAHPYHVVRKAAEVRWM